MNSVILLLSGGNDSKMAAEILIKEYQVHGLCIDGKQGKEIKGAIMTASEIGIPLQVLHIPSFDEETWDLFKLILRDIKMGRCAIKEARKIGAIGIATGVKSSDLKNPKLWWLGVFLFIAKITLKVLGLRLIQPLMGSNL